MSVSAFDASPLFGIGIGYNFNEWLRFDMTGEYRSSANFHGSQIITSPGGTITDEYYARKKEWLFLLNGYVDLGTWQGFTPFVGAGVGFSHNTIASFQDICTPCPGGGVAFAEDTSKWNFAWALHAGLAYKVTKNFTVELAYRYVNLGNARVGRHLHLSRHEQHREPDELREADVARHQARPAVQLRRPELRRVRPSTTRRRRSSITRRRRSMRRRRSRPTHRAPPSMRRRPTDRRCAAGARRHARAVNGRAVMVKIHG